MPVEELLRYFELIHPREVDLDLKRIQRVLSVLGNPEKNLPPTIHVAGTNGKGSTIAFMRSMLKAAGFSVHAYTSPHLKRFNERIHLNGQMISDAQLEHYLDRVRQANKGEPLTFFEGTTAAAFLAFHECPADFLLLETGLGGRLDATNVIDHPLATVLTPISIDHQDFLGEGLEAIAGEKVGILKSGAPCISAPQPQPVRDVIEQRARDLGVTIHTSQPESVGHYALSLLGDHQKINAATAVACLQQLLGERLTDRVIQEGLSTAHWPGRLQKLSQTPEIWVDGAHNEDGFKALRQQMEVWQSQDARPLRVFSAMLKNRDPKLLIEATQGLTDHLVLVDMGKPERFHSPQEFVKIKGNVGHISSIGIDQVFTEIFENTEKSPRNLIAGSLYLVGDVLKLWEIMNADDK